MITVSKYISADEFPFTVSSGENSQMLLIIISGAIMKMYVIMNIFFIYIFHLWKCMIWSIYSLFNELGLISSSIHSIGQDICLLTQHNMVQIKNCLWSLCMFPRSKLEIVFETLCMLNYIISHVPNKKWSVWDFVYVHFLVMADIRNYLFESLCMFIT